MSKSTTSSPIRRQSPCSPTASARLAPGASGFKGLGENAGVPEVEEYSKSRPGKAAGDSLAGHIAEWKITLERLARQFAAGEAKVLLESQEIILRGGVKARIAKGDITGFSAHGEDLVVETKAGRLRLGDPVFAS